MAIVQISRITNRKGYTEDLPQLAGAELGWCVDSRRLFIGNGTLQDGAPEIGTTENKVVTKAVDVTSPMRFIRSWLNIFSFFLQIVLSKCPVIIASLQPKLLSF